MSDTAPIVGIDLGSTRCSVAVCVGGAVRMIESPGGLRSIPSVVAFGGGGRVLAGAPARPYALLAPQRTVVGAKRWIGRAFDSPDLQPLRAASACEVVRAPNGDAWLRPGEAAISPSEVQAYLLEALRQIAAHELGAPVTRAVVTVPAHFDEIQRRATRDAAAIAGLGEVRLLAESTAAALAAGLPREQSATVAVVDVGASSCDVTVLRVEDGLFEVVAATGDRGLGGDEVDRRIAARLRDELVREHGVDPSGHPVAMQRLLDEAEAAKRLLSEATATTVVIPNLVIGPRGPVSVARALERAELETWIDDLLERLAEPCRAAVSEARRTAGDVDLLMVVGGMARMPSVGRRVAALFGRPPVPGVHPDEVIALGAAIEGAILDGEVDDVVAIEVATHTIGIRAAGDRLLPIVARASVTPTRVRKVFAAPGDEQKPVVVEVYQGDDPVASRNRLLARLQLTDLPPGRRGESHVEVVFTVDASGCLAIAARDMKSGRPSRVEVLAGPGLDPSTLQRLCDEHRRSAP